MRASSRLIRQLPRTSAARPSHPSTSSFFAPARQLHHNHTPRTSPLQRPHLPKALSGRLGSLLTIRHESSSSSLPASQPLSQSQSSSSQTARPDVPSYEMTFTCARCKTRSTHRVSKQGYYHGTVLITCPGCKNRHLISDHLKIFSDKRVTLEDIMKEKGNLVKRGTLGEGEEGDVEFWDDGTRTERGSGGPEGAGGAEGEGEGAGGAPRVGS